MRGTGSDGGQERQEGRRSRGRHHQEDRGWRRRRRPWRRLEGGVRRLRDGDDGVLPADVAAERDDRRPAQGPRRLFQPQQPVEPRLVRHRPAVRRSYRVRRRRPGVRSRLGRDHRGQTAATGCRRPTATRRCHTKATNAPTTPTPVRRTANPDPDATAAGPAWSGTAAARDRSPDGSRQPDRGRNPGGKGAAGKGSL